MILLSCSGCCRKDCITPKAGTHRSSETAAPLKPKYSHRPKRNPHTVRAKFATREKYRRFRRKLNSFYEFRLCFLSEFFIEPSRFFAGIDAASGGMKLCDLRSSTAERRICGCLRARYASCFAGKNAAGFPLKRANDGGFFLIILRSQSAFLPLHLATLHAIKMTESI